MRTLLACAAMAFGAIALAQTTTYTLVDDNARWLHSEVNPAVAAIAPGAVGLNNVFGNTTDHAYQNWWWIRVDNETRESALNNQTGFVQVGPNSANLEFQPTPNIIVRLNYTLDGDYNEAGGATVVATATVTNTAATPSIINLYHYNDFSLNGTVSGDTTQVVAPDTVLVTEGLHRGRVTYLPAPNAISVGNYSLVRSPLTDNDIDNLTLAAGPFTGDEGAASQWTFGLGPGESRVLRVTVRSESPEPSPRIILTDGAAVFQNREITTGRTNPAGSADIQTSAWPDHLFRNWWYYRTNNTSREYGLSNLVAVERFGANERKLLFNEAAENLAFELTYKLAAQSSNQAVVKMDYKITNIAAAAQTVNFFHYADFDVDGSGADDLVAYDPILGFKISDSPNYVAYNALGANGYQAGSLFLSLFTDTDIDNLANTAATSFDVSAGHQWVYNLAPGASATGVVYIGLNTDVPSNTPAIPGDTDASGCVDDADLTNIILDFGGAGGSSSGFAGTDINNDGIVDDADLTDLILNFGAGC